MITIGNNNIFGQLMKFIVDISVNAANYYYGRVMQRVMPINKVTTIHR